METAALLLAVLALLLALAARAKAAGLAGRIEEASADSCRRAENVQEAVERALETERRLLAQIAAGARLSREQILEGRLWGEVEPREAAELVAGGDVRLLDVHTPQETAAGSSPASSRGMASVNR